LSELKTVLPYAELVIEGFFGERTGHYTLSVPYPVLLRSPYRGILGT